MFLRVKSQSSRKEHEKEVLFLVKDPDTARSRCANNWDDLAAVAFATLAINRAISFKCAAVLRGCISLTASNESANFSQNSED